MKNSTNNKKINQHIFFILGILFIVLLWNFGAIYFENDYIVPSVKQTLYSLIKLLTEWHTYNVLGHTFLRLFLSISLCFVLGVILASLSKISYKFKAFVKPLFNIMKTLPIIVIIILLLTLLEQYSLYFIVGFVVLPIVYEATLNGLDSIDRNIVEEVKMNTIITPYVVGKVYIPLTLPYLLTSLLQSFGLGLKVLVMAEFIANTDNSIGNEIIFYREIPEMSYVYAWCIILVIFVLIVDVLLNSVKKNLA